MPILKKVLAGAVAPGALVLWSVSMVLVNPAPAHAEKTAEQIKCEEDGGSWVDKGEGNTFCFKKLPPMSKADGPGGGGSGGVVETCAVQTAREAGSGMATGRMAACDHAINTKGAGAAGKSAGPGGEPRDCDDDDDGAADRTAMAIKTKGAGAQRGGVSVAAGDVDGDGAADLAVEACSLAIKTKGTSAK